MLETILTLDFADPAAHDVIDSPATVVARDGALHVDGKGVLSTLLPRDAGQRMRVTLDLTPLAGRVQAICGNDEYEINLTVEPGDQRPQHLITKRDMHLLGRSRAAPPTGDGVRRVTFDFNAGNLTGSLDDQALLAATDPYPCRLGRYLGFRFWGEMLLHRLTVEAEPGPAPKPRRRRDGFFLEANVDFTGHLYSSAFTHDMFDTLARELAACGVSRVHWIYNAAQHGFWLTNADGVVPRLAEHTAQTEANVGDLFKAGVEACHRHGMKVFGLLKPMDKGCLSRLGGKHGSVPAFLEEHPELSLARKPRAGGDGINKTITRVDLVAEDDAPVAIKPADLELYASKDNRTYEPCGVTCREIIEDYPVYAATSDGVRATGASRRARVFRFDGLRIDEPYILVNVRGDAKSFSNDLANLIHLYGEAGRETHGTLGITTRAWLLEKHDGFTQGVKFDYMPGSPAACFPGYCAMDWPHKWPAGFIAVARGCEENRWGMPSPSFGAVRDWWLRCAQHVFDCGAEGLEIRLRNHNSPLSFRDLGFEKPVRDAYLQRTGVDVWEADDDAIDWEQLRRLRGEGFTAFLHAARKLADDRGRLLGLHVSTTMDMHPAQGGAAEIHWDWPRWIADARPDSITMKQGTPGSRLAEDTLDRAGDIPVIDTPYDSPSADVLQRRVDLARAFGFAGFQQYTPLFRINPDDHSLRYEKPAAQALRAYYQQTFAKR